MERSSNPQPIRENHSVNYAGAIYGTIVAMSVILTTSYESDLGSGRVAFWTVVTTTVFWLAHVYMRVVDAGFARPAKAVGVARRAMRYEWPMVQSALIPAAVLMLGVFGLVGDELAIDLSLWAGVAVLFGAGILIGRRDSLRLRKCIVIGVVNALIGLLILGLKIFVH